LVDGEVMGRLMGLDGEVRCIEKSYAGGRQKPNIESDNDRGCDTASVFLSSQDAVDVVDLAGVE